MRTFRKPFHWSALLPIMAGMALAVGIFLLDRLNLAAVYAQTVYPGTTVQAPGVVQQGTAYPGPTQVTPPPPYPGLPTATQAPTQPGSPATRTPTAAITLTLFPTSELTSTQVFSGTPSVLPMPTLELLFPGDLTREPSPTSAPRAAAAAIEADEPTADAAPSGSVLFVVVILLWGLLGSFLVVYVRRVGY